jgi:hypothetical protein
MMHADYDNPQPTPNDDRRGADMQTREQIRLTDLAACAG